MLRVWGGRVPQILGSKEGWVRIPVGRLKKRYLRPVTEDLKNEGDLKTPKT